MGKKRNRYAGCVLTCNSSWIIKKTLGAMINQTKPFDEIILVDDDSRDNTVSIAGRMLEQSGISYKIFKKTKRDIAISRNIAWKNAESNYICYIDSDLVIDPNWLENMAKVIDKKNEDATVVHEMLNITDKKTLKYLFFPAYGLEKDLTNEYFIKNSSFASTIIKKEILEEVGGFHSYSNTGEDADLIMRIRKKKPAFKFLAVINTSSWHYPPPGIKNALKKSYKWGKGAGLVAIRHRTPLAIKKAGILMFPPLTFPIFFMICFIGIYRQKANKIYSMNVADSIISSTLFVAQSALFGLGVLTNIKYLIRKFPEIRNDFPGTYKLYKQGDYSQKNENNIN